MMVLPLRLSSSPNASGNSGDTHVPFLSSPSRRPVPQRPGSIRLYSSVLTKAIGKKHKVQSRRRKETRLTMCHPGAGSTCLVVRRTTAANANLLCQIAAEDRRRQFAGCCHQPSHLPERERRLASGKNLSLFAGFRLVSIRQMRRRNRRDLRFVVDGANLYSNRSASEALCAGEAYADLAPKKTNRYRRDIRDALFQRHLQVARRRCRTGVLSWKGRRRQDRSTIRTGRAE